MSPNDWTEFQTGGADFTQDAITDLRKEAAIAEEVYQHTHIGLQRALEAGNHDALSTEHSLTWDEIILLQKMEACGLTAEQRGFF